MRSGKWLVRETQIGGRTIRRDEAGFLTDSDDWSNEVAQFIAAEENVELTAEHMAIIAFMRGYLDDHGLAPDARFAFAFLADRHGESKADARRRFFELFPYGYVKQACKIAGMRQPRAWSTG